MNRLKELDRNDLRRHGKDVTLHKAISHPFWLIGAIELSKIKSKHGQQRRPAQRANLRRCL